MPTGWTFLIAIGSMVCAIGAITSNPFIIVPGLIGSVAALVWHRRIIRQTLKGKRP